MPKAFTVVPIATPVLGNLGCSFFVPELLFGSATHKWRQRSCHGIGDCIRLCKTQSRQKSQGGRSFARALSAVLASLLGMEGEAAGRRHQAGEACKDVWYPSNEILRQNLLLFSVHLRGAENVTQVTGGRGWANL